jgi:hypothetical protein
MTRLFAIDRVLIGMFQLGLFAVGIASVGSQLTPTASAQTTTWTGAVDDNWFNAGNWDNGIPNSAAFTGVVGAPSPTDFNGNNTLGSLSVLAGGILNVSDGDNFDFGGAGSISNAGQINVGAGSDFQIFSTVTNNGTITVAGAGTASDLEMKSATTLAGSGTVFLNGTNARISDTDSGATLLTNSAGHTIRGNGNVGANNISILNNGLIKADVDGQTMIVDPASTIGLTNNGILRAEGGGILLLTGGDYDNTNGTILSAGGQVRLSSAVISGGLITGADFLLQDGNSTFTDLMTDAAMLVSTNAVLNVNGTITNNGTITVAGLGSTSGITLGSPTIFAGSGTIILNGANERITDSISAATLLTNGVNHTIRGNGNVGFNAIAILNNGQIKADVDGQTMIVDPASVDGLTNNGILRAEGGGILRLASGDYDNTGGTIVSAGGQVQLSGASITGGLITGADVSLPNGASGFTDLTTNATIEMAAGATLDVEGTITNNGTITVRGSTGNSIIQLQDATTFAGSGTIVLDGANARILDTAAGATLLTNGANHTIRGYGNVGANVIGIVNNGLIMADVAGAAIIIDPAGSSSFTNNGLVRAEGGAVVQLNGGDYSNTNGTIEAIGANSSVTATNATFQGRLGTLRAVDGQILLGDEAFGDITDSSTVYEFSGTTAYTDIFNDGRNGHFNGAGPGGPGDLRSTFFGQNQGLFRIGDGLDFTSLTIGGAHNSGTIVAGAGSTFSMGGVDFGEIICVEGEECDPDALPPINEFLPLISTGTLAGSGVIKNTNTPGQEGGGFGFIDTDDLHSEGFIKPGDNPGETGTLTLRAKDIFLGDDNVIEIELGSGGFDSLALVTDANPVALNGSLEVSLLSGFAGGSFDIVTAVNGLTGTFDSLTLPTLGGGLEWIVQYGANAVTIETYLPGDFDEDGDVDGRDFLLWQRGGSPNTLSGTDLAAWQNGYGIDNSPIVASATAVPEPSTCVLLSLATVVGALAPRRRFAL